MTAKTPGEFTRYRESAIEFLAELSVNNDRDWFKANQTRYEEQVREPTLAFIRAMEPRLRKLSKHLVACNKKVGGSMMRPQRDTRFAKDKTPYKTNVGVQFRHEAGKDVHAPGLYVHFDLDEVFIGVGMWHPDGPTLAAMREYLDEQPRKWLKVRDEKTFNQYFSLGGESLKRPPKGYDADHPLIDDLKRKDFIAVADLTLTDLFKPRFTDKVETHFKAARPFMKLICEALDLPF
ncbi:MAG: DUF2461 domain-containing protein [bacterium]|nr:DUF2461 domain-containing protein [bacterium]